MAMRGLKQSRRAAPAAFALLLLIGGVCGAEEYPISGVSPSERPSGAPVVSEAAKGAAWYRRALTGLTPPYPGSLRFLEEQGGWYTPFTRPGMPGNYDLRGWHRPPP